MSKIAEYKKDLADLMETYNDSSTPKEVKDSLSPAIEKLKALIKEGESEKTSVVEKKAETKKEAPTKKATPTKKPTEAKKPQPKKAEPKAEPKAEAKSKTALERCKEILAKYNKQKKTSAKRVENRRKQGKPATLTPSETLSKAAKSVKSKIVEMKSKNPKGLSQGQKDSLKTNIIKSVQSALAGIVGAKDKQKFITDLISALKSIGSKLPKVAEGGAILSSTLGGLDANPRFSPDSPFFMESGGDIEEGNSEMLHSNVVEIVHHSKEISDLLKSGLSVEPWVLAKSERASTDLSDITHYLEGLATKGKLNFASGGRLLSALNRDRNYKSNQSWEQRYKRKYKPKNPKYSYENGGMMSDDDAIETANHYMAYGRKDYNHEPISDPMVARRIVAEMEREDDSMGEYAEGGLMSDRNNRLYSIGDIVGYEDEEYTIVIGRGGIVNLRSEQGHLISPESPMWNKILKEGSLKRKHYEYSHGGKVELQEIDKGGDKLKFNYENDRLFVDSDTLDYLMDLKNPMLQTNQFRKTPMKDVFMLDTYYLDNDEFDAISKVFNKKFKRGGYMAKGGALDKYHEKHGAYITHWELMDILKDEGYEVDNDVDFSVIANKLGYEWDEDNDQWYKTMANGGMMEESVDLFEDYENIPSKVQKVLDKYSEAFEDGDYKALAKAVKELNKIGYTFDYDLDGQAYGLRKMADGGYMDDKKKIS